LILVGYASKHGATAEIAERIAEILTLAGQYAEARPVQQAGDLGRHEGFVIGSAAYLTHSRKDATAFVMSNRDLWAHRPVWLFSTGPLGTDATDAKGVDLRTTAEPKEIPGFREAIHPRRPPRLLRCARSRQAHLRREDVAKAPGRSRDDARGRLP